MKKTALLTIILFIISFTLATATLAESVPVDDFDNNTAHPSSLIDEAQLLTSEEASLLKEKLDKIGESTGIDVAIMTIRSSGDIDIQATADDIYDYSGYGYGENADGILLLLDISSRQFHMTTSGECITIFTDEGLKYIDEKMSEYLAENEFYEGFDEFADQCLDFISSAREGSVYDVGNMPKDDFSVLFNIVVCLIIGIAVGFISVSAMKSNMKNVKMQSAAGTYLINGSLEIGESKDTFLYSNVTKIRKPDPPSSSSGGTSVHTSSSGHSHGGHSGRF